MNEKDTTLPKRELIEEYISCCCGDKDAFSELALFYLKNFDRLDKIENIIDHVRGSSREEYERCIQEGIFTREEAEEICDLDIDVSIEVSAFLDNLLDELECELPHIKFYTIDMFDTSNLLEGWDEKYRYLKLKKDDKELELELRTAINYISKPGKPYFWSVLYLKNKDTDLLKKIKSLYRAKDAWYIDPVDIWKNNMNSDVELRLAEMSVPLIKGVSREKIKDKFKRFLNKLQKMSDEILGLV